MGKLIGIGSHEVKRGDMIVYAAAKVSFKKGIGDDYRGAMGGDRQVTIMTKENWDIVNTALGVRLHWTTRRANLLIEGVELENTKGKLLKIGEVLFEITGELAPCNRMDEERLGLKEALTANWRGGVTCKVLVEGQVQEGNPVTLLDKK